MITNYLSPLEFELSIRRLPAVGFFVQRATIPGISINAVEQPTLFNKVYHPGDEVSFPELSISFVIDEKMANYLEVFNWMIALAAPVSFDQFERVNESAEGLQSDITLLIKNSNKNPNIKMVFTNAFPTLLSEVQLDTTPQDLQYPEATVSFRYDTYTIEVV